MKNINKIIFSTFVSKLGSSIFSIALTLLAYKETGSNYLIGIIFASTFLPNVLFSLIGGVLADKNNKKKLLVLLDFIGGFFSIVILFLSLVFYNKYLLYISLNMVLSTIGVLYSPISRALLPEIIPKGHLKIYNSKYTIVNETIRISSPLLAMMLCVTLKFSLDEITIINGISFILSALLIKSIDYEPTIKISQKKINSMLLEAFSYFKNEKSMLMFILVISCINFFLIGNDVILMPLLKSYGFSESIYSYFLVIQSIGAISGTIVMNKFFTKIDENRLFSYSILNISIFSLFFYLINIKEFIFVYSFMLGFSLAIFNILFFTKIQTTIPKDVLGRIFSIIYALSYLLTPIGSFVFIYIFELMDKKVLIVSSSCLLFISLILNKTLNFKKSKHNYDEVKIESIK